MIKHATIILTTILFILILVGATFYNALAKRLEKDYQKQYCDTLKGIIEYRLPDGTRIDCLTEDFAIEFDFQNKWAECFGQAKYYSKKINRELGKKTQPACALIVNEKGDKYIKRLEFLSEEEGLIIMEIAE